VPGKAARDASHVGLNGALCEWQVKDGKFVLDKVLNVTN